MGAFADNVVLNDALLYVLPFVLAPLAIFILVWRWLMYIRMKNILDPDQWVLLEIILPKEIFRSPRSMEIALGGLAQGYAGNWWTKIASGSVRTWFSLEMVSLEGKVHFYIRTLKIFKHTIESQIYAQYGDIEIRESDDYVGLVKFGREEGWELAGAQLKLSMEDAYPIRTYVDYGLDNELLKEETKSDPITPTIEFLGSIGKGEYAFIQILVMLAKDRAPVKGFWFKKQSWKDEGKELVKKLSGKDKPPKEGLDVGAMKLSPGELEIVKAVERSISKIGFDCGIRFIYAAKEEDYKVASQLALGNQFTQYSTLNLNGFKTDIATSDDSPVRKFLGLAKKKIKILRTIMLDAYRLRSYFYPPYQYKPFVLNTEELATIFHFPGGVITTGGLPRIESKKAEPPQNLPT